VLTRAAAERVLSRRAAQVLTAAVVAGAVAACLVAWLLLAPGAAFAHGVAPDPRNGLDLLLAWQLEAHVLLPLLGAALLYRWAVGVVRRAHPDNPVPRYRVVAWNLGLFVLLVALASPIATYDTTLFAAHMIQHLLMVMVAAPLLAIGAPITLLLRVASPDARQRYILPVLHSRIVRVLAFPVIAWVLFAAVMWASHFSSLFDAALDNGFVHLFEHALYLGAALLFWWPVVGADPSPWRMPHPARVAYLFLGMPQSSFLGLAIFTAPEPLYTHYVTLVRTWGPTPLNDQQLAGGLMWAGGDAAFLIAMIVALWIWLRAEERAGKLADEKLDRDAALRARPSAHVPADVERPA
jgi:putative copper resistance protein D